MNARGKMLPAAVSIDPHSGEISSATGRYEKRLSEMRGFYRNAHVLEALLTSGGDVVTYQVAEFREPESDICFGTTTMFSGRVDDEFFMTRGHFHARRDRGEIYYTQSGDGMLLLESRSGECRVVEMKPQTCAFIPPDWAHRSVNIGPKPLVFVWACSTEAGHDYAEIQERGMRNLIVERDGKVAVIPNPTFAG